MTYFRAVRTIMGPVCLTAVFGMGTGVSTRVWSPGRSLFTFSVRRVYANAKRKQGGGKSCVSIGVGGEVNAVKRSAVSTGQLSALLHLHTPPIDLVIFQEPSSQRDRRPRLAEGFTLRCLQRLSVPYVATQRCA